MKQVREHRKKQRVQEPAQSVEGAGTVLAMHSSDSAPFFGRSIPTENAALFRGCVKKALEDPLPVSRLHDYPDMRMLDQRDVLFQCKQRVPMPAFLIHCFHCFFFFF